MKHRDGILDLVRGISALLVMLGHLRAFLFIDYADAGALNPLWKVFYLITGLGHQAVMVFFVLSGYFVGGSVLSAMQRGHFSWNRYATARLSRLWTVLVPALLLTLLLDTIGRQFAPGAYTGQHAAAYFSGPTPAEPVSLALTTFLGNFFFIQTIETPVYGSNGPLWSLANEFWYYVLFPLLVIPFAPLMRAKGSVGVPPADREPANATAQSTSSIQHSTFKIQHYQTLLSLALATAILFWLPLHLSSLGLVWLMGVLVWWIAQRMKPVRVPLLMIARIALAPLFCGSLLASKTGHWFGSDWMVGTTFSLWMLTLLGPWKTPGWWSRLSTGLSEVSYTLYVVHFPILFFVAATAMAGTQMAPGIHAAAVFAGLAIGTIVISAVLWWLFERNTQHVRNWMNRFYPQRVRAA